jgi:hypothetical protein
VNHTDTRVPRRLQLFLRDHRILEAMVRVPEDQTLSTYLSTRSRYIHLTDVNWPGTEETDHHIALKVGTVLWASSRDGDLPLTGGGVGSDARRVDVELEGGYLLSAGLMVVDGQGLSDFLQSAPAFIPLRSAELRPRGKALGDIVVNQDAIQAVRDRTDPARSARTGTTRAGATSEASAPGG